MFATQLLDTKDTKDWVVWVKLPSESLLNKLDLNEQHLRTKLGHKILRPKPTEVSDSTNFDFVDNLDINTKTADFLAN